MKKLTLLFVLLGAATYVTAQKKQNVYYYKNNGKEVSLKDSADFIRVIQEPDSGSAHFILLEYYPNGKRKTVGTVSKFEPRLVYEGQLLSLNKNGDKKSMVTYENGKPKGTAYYYFNNGTLQKTIEYSGAPSIPDIPIIPAADVPIPLDGVGKIRKGIFKVRRGKRWNFNRHPGDTPGVSFDRRGGITGA